MGIACSRRHHHGNRTQPDAAQQPQAPLTYPYPYPYPQRGRRDTGGFVPFPPYGPGLPQYNQARQSQMPPTHGSSQPHASSANTELHQTKTIRNRVNLKKPTLKLIRLEDDDNKLVPRFVFDASAPCSATVFYMAQEDSAKKSKLTTITQPPGPRAMYQAGMGQVFPPEGKEGDYALNMSQYMEEDLTHVHGDVTFPMIIRLETSQTTYVYLIKDGNKWEPRTVKQKIWVEGISYELQEIYGIHEFYSNDKKEAAISDKVDTFAEDLEGRECVICLAAFRDTTVLPCRHMCMCASCARELQRQQVSTCPICRIAIESLLYIKRQEKKSHDAPSTEASSTNAVKSA